MSLLLTRSLEVRANANLDQWITRPSQYGALDVFMQQSNGPRSILSDELKSRALTAVGRDVKVPVYDSNGSVVIGSTRTATIADVENTSRMVTIAFTTYSWGFTVTPSNHLNNEMGAQMEFEKLYLDHLYLFANTLDSACLSALSTAKSQVFGDLLEYTNTGNVIIASNAQKDEIIGDLTPIMKSNDFYGTPYNIIGNTGLESRIQKMYEKGLYNDTNKQIQFNDKNFHFSNRLSNASGHAASGYILNPGSVGMLFRMERESIAGRVTPTHQWGMTTLPVINVPVSTYEYYGVGDNSALFGAATADNTRSYKEHYGFSVDVATVVAYNDNVATKAAPIAKFAIQTAE